MRPALRDARCGCGIRDGTGDKNAKKKGNR